MVAVLFEPHRRGVRRQSLFYAYGAKRWRLGGENAGVAQKEFGLRNNYLERLETMVGVFPPGPTTTEYRFALGAWPTTSKSYSLIAVPMTNRSW